MYSFDLICFVAADIIFENFFSYAVLTLMTMSCCSGHLGLLFKGLNGFREKDLNFFFFQILERKFYVKTCPVVVPTLEYLPNQTLYRGIAMGMFTLHAIDY